MKQWTPDEAKLDALQRHVDCTFADWTPGLDVFFNNTIVVYLWRNQECWTMNDPPKYTCEGYPR